MGKGTGNLFADGVLLFQILHGSVDLVDSETAVNRLHGLGSVAEGVEGLLVDVCSLYTGNLALEVHDLRRRLFQRCLELLLLSQGILGGCAAG